MLDIASDRVLPLVVELHHILGVDGIQRFLAKRLAEPIGQRSEVPADQAQVRAMGHKALAAKFHHKDIEIILIVVFIQRVDRGKGLLRLQAHRLSGSIQQLQRLFRAGPWLVIPNSQHRIPHPLEVHPLGNGTPGRIPVAPGIVRLKNFTILRQTQRLRELGLELIIDGIHDVPANQHHRRPAAGQHDAAGVDGEYIQITLDEGPLSAEDRQRLVAVFLVVIDRLREQSTGLLTLLLGKHRLQRQQQTGSQHYQQPVYLSCQHPVFLFCDVRGVLLQDTSDPCALPVPIKNILICFIVEGTLMNIRSAAVLPRTEQ